MNCCKTTGTLYGIGVGPGAPDLLTLRAVEVLKKVDVVLAAASPKNEQSLSLTIAGPHLPPNVETVRLDFPMTRDKAVLEKAWAENAAKTAALLESGKNCAFLTLGDPLIYSTFGYLMRTLAETAPHLAVEAVPGITSYQAAAAKSRTILCEGKENLLLIAGINGSDELDRALEGNNGAIILKTYRNSEVIRSVITGAGRAADVVFASRLGLEGEIIATGLDGMPEAPHYLSLLLSPPRRG